MAISIASDTLRMLAVVGLELWHAHLIGGAPPSHTRRYNRMKELQPGDLVIETSTSGWWRKSGQPHPGPYEYLKVENAIGFLDRITREPFPHEEGDDLWDEAAEGRPEPLEEVFYIRRLDGEYKGDEAIFRWTNASFVTILPKEGWKGLLE
jgi:hypothetical protein